MGNEICGSERYTKSPAVSCTSRPSPKDVQRSGRGERRGTFLVEMRGYSGDSETGSYLASRPGEGHVGIHTVPKLIRFTSTLEVWFRNVVKFFSFSPVT